MQRDLRPREPVLAVATPDKLSGSALTALIQLTSAVAGLIRLANLTADQHLVDQTATAGARPRA